MGHYFEVFAVTCINGVLYGCWEYYRSLRKRRSESDSGDGT